MLTIPTLRRVLLGAALSLLTSPLTAAAELPPHDPLRILIVSDRVNPHGLPPEDLTEPGDISAALLEPGTGLNLDPSPDAVWEIPTNDIHLATAALSVSRDDPAAYDVLIYFSHRIPNDESSAQNIADQEDFVLAVESFLVAGGGVMSFHHGIWGGSGGAGKESMLEILSGSATSISWNTTVGQNVINVAPGHFITTQSIEYSSQISYDDPANGIPLADYDAFNNTPDERYQTLSILPTAADIQILFASDYAQNGTRHVLGFTHDRPEWSGSVFVYQPGEYQPNALDDKDGNNFQILASAMVFLGDRCETPAEADNYGSGWPGTLGIPALTASATPIQGSSITLDLQNSQGSPTLAVLFAGFDEADIPSSWGGSLLVGDVFLVRPWPLPTGGFSLPLTVSNDPSLCALELYLQFWEADIGASRGVSFTQGLRLRYGN